ncbi:MAG: hypothetical protein KIS67_06475 [Verrucomicrobiae bacterium]|nr:hypothetical protein [Verrucomicrobiae bacterium]
MREILTSDFVWKLFSVVLAVVIWLTVQTSRTERSVDWRPLPGMNTRTFESLPIRLVSATADIREFKVNPKIVEVIVGGRSDVLNALQEKDVRVTVDLSHTDLTADQRQRVSVSLPPGLAVIEIIPAEVDVLLPPKLEPNP